MTGRRMAFRVAFYQGGHASMVKHHLGPWRLRLWLVRTWAFDSKIVTLVLISFSECLVAEI